MKAGVKWLTTCIVSFLSVGVVGGCGNPECIPLFRSGHPQPLPPPRRGRRSALWLGIASAAVMWGVVPGMAGAAVHSQMVCAVSSEVDPETGEAHPVTSCVHTESSGPGAVTPPATLDVQLASRGCFYLGDRSTNWVNLGYDDAGNLEYGWSPSGAPGGHNVIGTAPPCSWPTVEREEIEGYVWRRIGNYTHQAPQVSFDPPVPWGVTGIETFAALVVPAPWTFSSTSPYTGNSLEAQVWVDRVRLDWDDGPRQVFDPADFSGFTGHPDGVASHTYQTKSCQGEGRRCRDKKGPYRVKAAFVWSGWYEVAGDRKTLTIPRTSSFTDYPVKEIISLVVGDR